MELLGGEAREARIRKAGALSGDRLTRFLVNPEAAGRLVAERSAVGVVAPRIEDEPVRLAAAAIVADDHHLMPPLTGHHADAPAVADDVLGIVDRSEADVARDRDRAQVADCVSDL